MQIIKKIFTLFLLSFFVLTNLNLVNAWIYYDEEKYYLDDIKYSEIDLAKIKNWAKYIKKIDIFIEKISKNEKKLTKLQNKINNLYTKKSLEWDIMSLLDYLSVKIEYELYKISEVKKLEWLKKFETVLSEEENKKFNSELIKLQQTLFENWVENFEKSLKEIEKYTNYEESGDLNISANFNKEEIWKYNLDLKLKNYLTKNSNFNSSFKAEIEALIEAAPKWEKAMKLQFNSFIDFISKDWNMYILLKDLNVISEENIKNFEKFIEQAKEIAKKNKYIKYTDRDSKMAMDMLKNLNPQNILSDWRKILSKPMFKAYKKIGNKYYLIPTKYACDSMKELSGKFDPFNANNSCSESQYNNMLKDLTETWEIYLELGKLKKFGFEMWKKGDLESSKGYVSFSDRYIEEIHYIITPDLKKYAWEGFNIDYKRNDSLNFDLLVKKEDIKYNFKSKLNNKNKFTFIDFKGHTADKYEDFSINLSLNNHIISWKMDINTDKYDWNTGKKQRANNYDITISGKTNVRNSLEKVNLNLIWTELSTKKKFEKANLVFSKWNIKFENNYFSDNSKNDIKLELSCNNNVLNSLDFDLSVKEKEWKYDYDTYEYVYSWELVEVVKSKILFKNSKISGQTVIKEKNWDSIFSVDHSWSYWKYKLDLKNDFELGKNPFEYITVKEEKQEPKKLSGELNIKFDVNNNKNNLEFEINLKEDSEKFAEYKIINNSKRVYKKDVKIDTPKNTIDIEEVMPTTYNEFNY